MMRFASLTAATLLGATVSASAADTWTVDHAASTLGFIGAQNGNEFTGSFGAWSADIAFSPDDLANSSVAVEIEMGSADAESDQRTGALPGRDWFNTASFPNATFSASNFNDLGDGNYEAVGTLQIRDVSLNVVLPFTLTIDGDQATVSGALDINRTDYGVGQGEFSNETTVAFGVTITVDLVASQ